MSAQRKPIPLPKPTALQDQISALHDKVDELLAVKTEDAARADAYLRFQTTGEQALPMTARQVGLVLGTGYYGAVQMVQCGHLRRRWPHTAGFHPDDVREALGKVGKRGPKMAADRKPRVNSPASLPQECDAHGGA